MGWGCLCELGGGSHRVGGADSGNNNEKRRACPTLFSSGKKNISLFSQHVISSLSLIISMNDIWRGREVEGEGRVVT